MEQNNKENQPPQPPQKPSKYFSERKPGEKGFSLGIVERYSKSHGRYLQYVPTDSEESSDSDDGFGYEDSSDEREFL